MPEADQWFLLGWTLVGGMVGNTGAFWPQDWTGGPLVQMDVAEIRVEWQRRQMGARKQMLAPLDKRQLWFNQAVQFATVFALLLMEAAHSGLHTRDERNGPAPPEGASARNQAPRLDHSARISRQKALGSGSVEGAEKLALSANSAASESSWSTDGKSLQDVMVHEHRRRQRFGKGLSQVRWVCIRLSIEALGLDEPCSCRRAHETGAVTFRFCSWGL